MHDLTGIGEPSPERGIERISPAMTHAYRDVIDRSFGMPRPVSAFVAGAIGWPGWTHYLGFEGDRAVATGALRVADGVGWIGIGGTVEEARGRGWQTAILQQRLRDARDAGCAIAVTETEEETPEEPVNHSFRNMIRTGFRLEYAREDWLRAPS